ncbi:MAG: biotin/lipoyl-binding protein [Planctomycetota bacterium]|nr:biotin/lipoyl-binding protein [Planctomycetota bacterium]
MDNISSPSEIAQVDKLLNELDRFSKLDIQPSKFYSELLRRLNHVVGSSISWVVHASSESKWHVLAFEGEESPLDCCGWLSNELSKHSQVLPVQISQRDLSGAWIGISLRSIGWTSGGIIIRLPATIPVAAEAGVAEVLSAFCEIANSFQLNEPTQRWESLRGPLRAISNEIVTCENHTAASRTFVNGVRSLLDADRVSLVRSNNGSGTRVQQNVSVLAISNAALVNTSSPVVQELLAAAKSIMISPNPNEAIANLAKQHEMASAIAIPLSSSSDEADENDSKLNLPANQELLIVEWANSDRYYSAASIIADVVPRLTDAWNHNHRAARVPARVRKLFNRSQTWNGRVKQVIWFCFGMVALAYFLSNSELSIRGVGTLQPKTQRFLFAPADGYVDSIFVKDGEQVLQDQIIARINSPALQIELNRIDAEIELVEEMKSGFNITINQLQSNDEKSILLGGQIAGEIKELEKKHESLLTQRELILKEQQRLELRSPISGTVIAWDLESQLESRPVKLGDALFRIANVGLDREQWRIEVPVADWESGYVSNAMVKAFEKSNPMKVTFALPSTPRETWTGTLESSGSSLYSYQGSQHLDFYVQLDEAIPEPRIGTTAIVSFPCGSSPRWFIWTRAMIDAIHRRFWF